MGQSTAARVQPVKKLFGLDHLRALAIVLVLFYHYRMFQHPAWLDDAIHFGWTGVDLFFVLSGYLIASQLFEKIAAGKNISFPEFFIKRAFRILPAYLLVLAIYFCIPYAREWEALAPLWKFLSFTQNFGFDIKNFGTFSHAWSLCVEEHFYLLLPLVLITLLYYKATHKAGWLLLLLLLLGFAARLFTWYKCIEPALEQDGFGITWYKYIYYPTYNRLDGLLAGISIAALFVFKPPIKIKFAVHGNKILLIGMLVLLCAVFFCHDQMSFHASIFGYPLIAIGYGLLVMAAVSSSCFLYKYSSKITSLLARLSFALYLVHKGVIHVVQPLLAKTGIDPKGNGMFTLCLLAALAAAWVLNLLVEQPFLTLREKLLQKRRAAKAAPGSVLVEEDRVC